jgi:hypothetical protein
MDAIHVLTKIILDVVLSKMDLPKAIYCAYNTGQENNLYASVESTPIFVDMELQVTRILYQPMHSGS